MNMLPDEKIEEEEKKEEEPKTADKHYVLVIHDAGQGLKVNLPGGNKNG